VPHRIDGGRGIAPVESLLIDNKAHNIAAGGSATWNRLSSRGEDDFVTTLPVMLRELADSARG